MEKYGVDKSDPIELRAQEMVKNGEFKTLREARREALAEKEKPADGDKV